MKNLFPVLVIIISFWGCHQEELKQAQTSRDSLFIESGVKDSLLNSYIGTINEVEGDLAAIREKETAISLTTKENPQLKRNQKEQIKEDIKTIRELMEVNLQKIDSLNNRLKKSGSKVSQLNKMVSFLREQLEAKEQVLASLNEQIRGLKDTVRTLRTTVNTLNTSVSNLTNENQKKTTVINEQTEKLNTAYYLVGTHDKLKKEGVLVKEGGLLGIGKSDKLSSTFDKASFMVVDITKIEYIPIKSKKAKLLSAHPVGSYRLEQDIKKTMYTQIFIIDPDKFWKASKYLVIVTD